MGTDINLYVEVKKDGKWINVDEWNKRGYWWTVPHEKRLYDGRNYRLFSVLADVRNWYDTPYEILPILEENRGLPKDIDPELFEKTNDFILGECHSCSWLTLKELLDYPWDIKLKFEGVYVKKEDLESGKEIDDWIPCDDRYDWEKCKNKEDYELTTIEVSLWTLCKEFTEGTIPKLKALGDPEDVRIIFGFD